MLCPNCNQEISDGSSFCQYCGEKIEPVSNANVETIPCPYCGEEILKTAKICKHCKNSVKANLKWHWNWGAFAIPIIWGPCHNQWWMLLGIIPYLGIIVAIIGGIKGNEYAWKAKNWESAEEFHEVQRAWVKWSFGISIVIIVLVLMLCAV